MGEILSDIMAVVLFVSFFILLILFITSIIKKDTMKTVIYRGIGLVVLVVIFIFVVTPGAKINLRLGDFNLSVEKSSLYEKLLKKIGEKLKAINTNTQKTGYFIFSAESASPLGASDLYFPVGEEYIKIIEESKDKRTIIYRATIPPGKELQAVSSSEVTLRVKNFFQDENESKVLEYYKSENSQ